MKITYRRLSGKIGVSMEERGSRGLWWEKRKALWRFLIARNHIIQPYGELTKPSQGVIETVSFEEALAGDVLMIEFGSSNMLSYGKDIAETIRLCDNFKGPKIYLCDDPDLHMLWKLVDNKNWSGWYNAVKRSPLGQDPFGLPIYDFPFSSLQEPLEPIEAYDREHFVYLGRPNGRTKIIGELLAGRAPIRVYGKQKEWDFLGVKTHEPPDQPNRARFYQNSLASLVLADKKHCDLGWRTGRAYHAALAGCPAVVQDSHHHLNGLLSFKNPEDLKAIKKRFQDPENRAKEVRRQQDHIYYERSLADITAKIFGL